MLLRFNPFCYDPYMQTFTHAITALTMLARVRKDMHQPSRRLYGRRRVAHALRAKVTVSILNGCDG
jgi:hypothetical protein